MKKKRTLLVLLVLMVLAILVQGLYAGSHSESYDGAEILQERCTVCHDTRRIERAGFERQMWERTVERMMGKPGFGSRLSDEERKALIEHLLTL